MSGDNKSFFGGLSLDEIGSDEKGNMIEVNETTNSSSTKEASEEVESIEGKNTGTGNENKENKNLIEVSDDINQNYSGESSDSTSPPSKSKASEQGNQEESNPILNSFAVVLQEEGVLSSFDPEKDKFKSYKELIDKIKSEDDVRVQAGIEAYKNSIRPDLKSLLEGEENGASLETLANLKLEERALNSVTEDALRNEDNEEVRRIVIATNLRKTSSLSDVKIKKLVDDYIKNGEDVTEAVEALSNLKALNKQQADEEIETAKAQKIKSQTDEADKLTNLQKMIESTTEFFPGNKADKNFKTKVYETLTKVIEKDKEGRTYSALTKKRAEDPMKFDMITAALVASGAYDGKWDNVLSAQKKNVYEELENVIKSSDKIKSGTSKSRPTSTSKSLLESLKQI